MRGLRRGKTARVVARALCLLLLAPYLCGPGAVRPASAQIVTLPVVIVLDFTNRTNVGGPLLGRSAAAALILEMKGADRWDVVRESVVQDAANRLNLQRPYDKIDLTRLANEVQATAVVTGEIVGARVTQRPPQASITMAVRVMDVASRELINGALVTGTSTPRPGYTGGTDVLLDEAVSKAAFLARESLERFQLPEGTVLNTTVVGTRYDALLNIGARQGVRRGMRFVVLRGRELVGVAEATAVDPDKSVAAIVENFRGVKPEDRVRAVYELPTFQRPRDRRTSADEPVVRVAGYAQEQEGGAVGAATGTVLAQAAPTGEAQVEPPVVIEEEETTIRVRKRSNTRALRIVGGALAVLGIGALAARKGGTRAFTVRADPVIFAGQAAIRVRWSRPRQVSSEDVVQYQIIRFSGLPQDFDRVVGVVTGDVREFIDTQHDPIDIDNVFTGEPGETTSGTTTLNEVPGIVPGVTYRYAIVTIFRPKVGLTEGDNGTGTGTGTDEEFEISQRSPFSNSVTVINPPTYVSPDNGSTVDFSDVTFVGNPVAGATTYVIQASTDALFKRNVKQLVRVVLPTPAPLGSTIQASSVNLNRLFPGATRVFWRIGARDDRNPGRSSAFLFANPRLVVSATGP